MGPDEILFTPDGRQIVTASPDGIIGVWDSVTGQRLRSLKHPGWATGVAVSPDGKHIASCSLDNTVRLWDLSSGKQIHRLKGHGRLGGGQLTAVSFSPDSQRFFSFGRDLLLRVWSVRTWKALAEHALRPSGVQLQETEGGEAELPEQRTYSESNPYNRLVKAQFTPDGTTMLLSDLRSLYVFDVASGKETDKLELGRAALNSEFVLSPDGKLLLVAETRAQKPGAAGSTVPSLDRGQTFLRLRELSTRETVGDIDLRTSRGTPMAVSPDGRLLAVRQSGEVWISIWDIRTSEEYARIDFQEMRTTTPRRVTFSPDSQRLATSHRDTTVLVWQLDQFRLNRPGTGLGEQ